MKLRATFTDMSILNKVRRQLRTKLDALYIRSAPWRAPDADYVGDGTQMLRSLRICLVKQETFGDLYTQPRLRGKELLYSTIHRSGPIGLFGAKSFDFFILKISDSEESTVWKYLHADMDGPLPEDILAVKDKPIVNGRGELITAVPQSQVAVSMFDVSWEQYDVIISINFSVDEKIIRDHPKQLWCYMLQEPSMRHYKQSMVQPLFSYDLFLNQKFTYQFSQRRRHEVNFPYNFMHAESFKSLQPKIDSVREGVFVEIHSVVNLTPGQKDALAKFGSVRFPTEERFEAVLDKMMKSKYFISLRGQHLAFKIWGNSMIDAVGAGLLAFGDPREYHNLDLFTTFTSIRSVEEFMDKIKRLENDPERYKEELALQQRLLNKYCFFEPLKKLFHACHKKQMA